MTDLEGSEEKQSPTRSSGDLSMKDKTMQDVENGSISEKSKYEVPQPDEREKYKVKFEDGDPENPMNFSSWYKAWLATQMGILCLTATLASSIIAPAGPVIAERFGVSEEVAVLSIALFILGYAIGPPLWAPVSEVYGRRWGMLPGVFILGLFSIGTAASNNAASVFITRLFGGIFGAAPITIAPGALGDFYEPRSRGLVMVLMSVAITGGPTLGPVIGAALTVNENLGWRWTEYMQAIITFGIFALTLICMPETYAAVLLKRKAKKMRASTGDDRYWHPHENEKFEVSNVLHRYLARPLRMFITEPMVTYITLYASFVYALIFLTLEVFPIVFLNQRHYSPVVSTLPFIGILVGVICGQPINLANQPRYARLMKKNGGRAVPEGRLPPMLAGGILLSGGLFMFGWTAAPQYHWALPVVGGAIFGAGFNIVFLQCLNYLVDTYGMYAASAIAANTIVRSLVAAGLPMAARPMFQNMGVAHAASLLGGISCLALPMPLVFMKYGAKLRERSKFVTT